MQNCELKYEKIFGGLVVTGYVGFPVNLLVPPVVEGEKVVGIAAKSFAGLSTLHSVTIGEGVEFIAEYAFEGCQNLALINLPQTLIRLGKNAFLNTQFFNTENNWLGGLLYISQYLIACKKSSCGLVSVNGCKVIGEDVFNGCQNIQGVVLAEGLTHINARAFLDCGLTSIEIPFGVQYLGDECFCGCVNLAQISLPPTIGFFGDDCFENTLAEVVSLKKHKQFVLDGYIIRVAKGGKYTINGAKGIAAGAFAFAEIEEVSGKNVTALPPLAFYGCKSLKKVDLPNAICVQEGAFAFCDKLKQTKFAANVQMHANAFFGAYKNNVGSNDDKVENQTAMDVVLYNRLVAISETVYGEYKARFGITHVEKQVFANNKQLSIIKLPETVKSIGRGFAKNCTFLKKVTLSNRINQIACESFEECASLNIVECIDSVKTVGDRGFLGCKSLVKLDIPHCVEYIGESAFAYCSNLELCYLPSNLQKLGARAFLGCSSVDFNLPKGITDIGKNCFEGARRLKNIDIPPKVTNLFVGTFKGCIALKTISFGDGLRFVFDDVFTNCSALNKVHSNGKAVFGACFENCTALTEIEISASQKIIAEKTFKNCQALKNVVFNDGVQVIRKQAFYGTHSLSKAVLPKSVVELGDECFAYSGVDEITLWDNTLVGERAFINCQNLKKINRGKREVSHLTATVGERAFADCKSLATVDLFACIKISKSAFEGDDALSTVNLAEGLQMLCDKAFFGCENLKSLVLPYSLCRYGKDVLKNARITKPNLIDLLKDEDGVLLKLGGNIVTYKVKNQEYKLNLPQFDESCFNNPNWARRSLKEFDYLFADSEAKQIKIDYVKYRLLYPYDLSQKNKEYFLYAYFQDIAKQSVKERNVDELIKFAEYDYYTVDDLQSLLEQSSLDGSVGVTSLLLDILRNL